MRIGLIGRGVVGGALEKCFKEAGVNVFVYDKYQQIGSIELAANDTAAIFLCLPTPTGHEQDLSALTEVLGALQHRGYKNPVVIKSTVLPGTCDQLQNMFPRIRLAHNPEFLTEKNAVADFHNQVVVMISSNDDKALHEIVEVYAAAKLPNHQYCQLSIDMKITELAKYIHNCTLAVKVALMNEFYDYANIMGADYADAADFAVNQGGIGGTHTKVPGPDGKLGFGGMCFVKDTEAILRGRAGDTLSIIRAAVLSNMRRRPGAYEGSEPTGFKLD